MQMAMLMRSNPMMTAMMSNPAAMMQMYNPMMMQMMLQQMTAMQQQGNRTSNSSVSFMGRKRISQ